MNKDTNLLIRIIRPLWLFLSLGLMSYSLLKLTPSGYLQDLSLIKIQGLSVNLLYGTGIGLLYIAVGIILFNRHSNWRKSMEFLVGKGLTKGNVGRLVIMSLTASIWEEGYTRGFVLVLFPKNYSGVLLIAFILNSLWALSHLLNNQDDLADSFTRTFKQATPHMIIIFLSGIPWYFITLTRGSIIPAIISHFVLDFGMGIFYRNQVKKKAFLK